jgi:hypothetical protein
MIPGAVLYIVAALIQIITMLTNKHFESTIRIQSDRKQQAIINGLTELSGILVMLRFY